MSTVVTFRQSGAIIMTFDGGVPSSACTGHIEWALMNCVLNGNLCDWPSRPRGKFKMWDSTGDGDWKVRKRTTLWREKPPKEYVLSSQSITERNVAQSARARGLDLSREAPRISWAFVVGFEITRRVTDCIHPYTHIPKKMHFFSSDRIVSYRKCRIFTFAFRRSDAD